MLTAQLRARHAERSRSHYVAVAARPFASFLGNVKSVPILSQEEFESIEFDAASSGDHAAAARAMTELAATGTEAPGMPRAEAFLRAGEQWLLADNPGEAADVLRRALAERGPVSADPRVPLARALFELGREDEARDIVTGIQSEGPADPKTCDLLAELLVEQSDLTGALDWATAGVELCLATAGQRAEHDQHGNDSELGMLLRLRYRIRNDLGLPEDDYDALLDDSAT
jgi:predicted Zn-dependent protease